MCSELIAPSLVVFYDHHWQFLGAKETLRRDITNRTGVDEEILSGRVPFSSRSIAQRMSWASSRETVRRKDRAYCLLGIFDVYMPMLYGEGDHAFIQLQQEIIKQSDDTSLFSWPIYRQNQPGLLADSPESFANLHNIVPVPSRKGRASYSVTNRGLSMRCMATPFRTDTYLVRLDCVYGTSPGFRTPEPARDDAQTVGGRRSVRTYPSWRSNNP